MDVKQSETLDEFRFPKIELSQGTTKRLPVASQLVRNGSGKGVLQSTHRFDSFVWAVYPQLAHVLAIYSPKYGFARFHLRISHR